MLATTEMTHLVVEHWPIFLDSDGLWIKPSADATRRDPIRIAGSFAIDAEICNDQFLDRGLLLRWSSGSDRHKWVMRRNEPRKDAVQLARVLVSHGLRVETGMAHLLRRFLPDARYATRIVGLPTTPAPARVGADA